MNSTISLPKRITVVTGLWLLASVVCAVFAELSLEGGENEWRVRGRILSLAPDFTAQAVASLLVKGHYETWQQREEYQAVIWWGFMVVFAVHAMIALTRRSRRQFLALSVVQVVLLAATVACVLYRFHDLAVHD